MESCKHILLSLLMIAAYTVGPCRAEESYGSVGDESLSTQKVVTHNDQIIISQPKQTFTVSSAANTFPNDPSVNPTIHFGRATNVTSSVRSSSNDLGSTHFKKSDKWHGKSPLRELEVDIAVTVGLLTLPLWLPPVLYALSGPHISASQHWTKLHSAASNGDPDLCNLLILKGANINARNGVGETPLHIAISRCSLERRFPSKSTKPGQYYDVCKVLIQHGAKLNIRSKSYSTWDYSVDGMSPLGLAASLLEFDIVELLLENGANCRLTSDWNRATPIFLALQAPSMYDNPSRDKEQRILEMLLAAGCDPNLAERNHVTPLQQAIRGNDLSAARLLVEHGTDIDRTPGTEAAMLTASRAGNLDIVKLLISHGANVSTVTKLGETPLSLARDHNHEDIAAYLIDHGAAKAKQQP